MSVCGVAIRIVLAPWPLSAGFLSHLFLKDQCWRLILALQSSPLRTHMGSSLLPVPATALNRHVHHTLPHSHPEPLALCEHETTNPKWASFLP